MAFARHHSEGPERRAYPSFPPRDAPQEVAIDHNGSGTLGREHPPPQRAVCLGV